MPDPPRNPTPPRPVATFLCTHCHSTDLEIQPVPSYCFRCRACGGGTPIEVPCRVCGARTRVLDRADGFYASCITCDHEELIFVDE